nr:helicase-related protein [uncultured Capnocytophaga sp.]
MSSKFFTNTEGNTLFKKFEGILKAMKTHSFQAVSAYFRSSGYFKMREMLKEVEEIKILVGINVDNLVFEAQRRGMIYFSNANKTKEEFEKEFIKDIKEAKYTKEVEDSILGFIQDIADKRIEVRIHNSHSIHAKFYILLPKEHSEYTDGWVIMGSSNLTDAGIGSKKGANYELNIALKDFDDVQFAKDEFNKLWANSDILEPTDVQAFVKNTYIGQEFTPFDLFIKLLIEYFGKNIDYDPNTIGDLPSNYKKLSYQIDAVNQGFDMLLKHNGFFLADVVGLGKTLVASMIAKRFCIANGFEQTKILVVTPPAVESNWKQTFKSFRLDKNTKFITNGSLGKIADGTDLDNYWEVDEYDLILVDEAHKYRNHTSQGFNHLQRICKIPRSNEGLIVGDKKKVILISATPLNNRPEDLYYQLQLFQDIRKSTLEKVSNLQHFFSPLIQKYREIMDAKTTNIEGIREIYKQIREKVIAEITVRRTRRDLKKYPKYLEDIKQQGIIFPEIAPLQTVEYYLNPTISKLFYKTILSLTDDDKINYYRYQAIRFLKKDIQEEYYSQAERVSQSLAAIMKTLMVKRLESSFVAFKNTLENLLKSTERMIEMFANNKVYIAPDLNINALFEKGLSEEEIDEIVLSKNVENARNNIFTADDFDPSFLIGLEKDAKSLKNLVEEWKNVTNDPKIEKLFDILDTVLLDRDKNPSQQLIIFTESNDTANYLKEKLSEVIDPKKILKISSENRNKVFEQIQANFDANYTKGRKNDLKILITTDVLAEGINLHRANVLLNYDTPWNATRLMQRLGRINRIGSETGVIYNYLFYPSAQGDEEIRLYKKAYVKLQGFHSAFGEDAQVFTKEELVEQFELFKEGEEGEEDKRLYYLRLVREFKDAHPSEFKRIAKIPFKARTARKNKNTSFDDVKDGSIIFMKSPYKREFYRVNAQKEVENIDFLEAAERFEASLTEKGYELPLSHYTDVNLAQQSFEKDLTQSHTHMVTSVDKADGNTMHAKKFLREIKGTSHQEEVKTACDQLSKLIDKGTFTAIPNEIKKIRQQLEKQKITYGQAQNMILAMTKKYATASFEETQEKKEKMIDFAPEIVISETFIK